MPLFRRVLGRMALATNPEFYSGSEFRRLKIVDGWIHLVLVVFLSSSVGLGIGLVRLLVDSNAGAFVSLSLLPLAAPGTFRGWLVDGWPEDLALVFERGRGPQSGELALSVTSPLPRQISLPLHNMFMAGELSESDKDVLMGFLRIVFMTDAEAEAALDREMPPILILGRTRLFFPHPRGIWFTFSSYRPTYEQLKYSDSAVRVWLDAFCEKTTRYKKLASKDLESGEKASLMDGGGGVEEMKWECTKHTAMRRVLDMQSSPALRFMGQPRVYVPLILLTCILIKTTLSWMWTIVHLIPVLATLAVMSTVMTLLSMGAPASVALPSVHNVFCICVYTFTAAAFAVEVFPDSRGVALFLHCCYSVIALFIFAKRAERRRRAVQGTSSSESAMARGARAGAPRVPPLHHPCDLQVKHVSHFGAALSWKDDSSDSFSIDMRWDGSRIGINFLEVAHYTRHDLRFGLQGNVFTVSMTGVRLGVDYEVRVRGCCRGHFHSTNVVRVQARPDEF